MASAQASTTVPSDSVNFVYEDNARGVPFALDKKIRHFADEHIMVYPEEIGTKTDQYSFSFRTLSLGYGHHYYFYSSSYTKVELRHPLTEVSYSIFGTFNCSHS
jgi:hypothetical protein